MPSIRLAIAAAFIAALGIHSASALEIDNNGSNHPAAVNLTDPDDSVPVAHIADDGSMQQPSSGFNLQVQSGSPSAFGYGLTPSHSGSAFDRAQQNQMGQ